MRWVDAGLEARLQSPPKVPMAPQQPAPDETLPPISPRLRHRPASLNDDWLAGRRTLLFSETAVSLLVRRYIWVDTLASLTLRYVR